MDTPQPTPAAPADLQAALLQSALQRFHAFLAAGGGAALTPEDAAALSLMLRTCDGELFQHCDAQARAQGITHSARLLRDALTTFTLFLDHPPFLDRDDQISLSQLLCDIAIRLLKGLIQDESPSDHTACRGCPEGASCAAIEAKMLYEELSSFSGFINDGSAAQLAHAELAALGVMLGACYIALLHMLARSGALPEETAMTVAAAEGDARAQLVTLCDIPAASTPQEVQP